jgi:hypothetical protein
MRILYFIDFEKDQTYFFFKIRNVRGGSWKWIKDKLSKFGVFVDPFLTQTALRLYFPDPFRKHYKKWLKC